MVDLCVLQLLAVSLQQLEVIADAELLLDHGSRGRAMPRGVSTDEDNGSLCVGGVLIDVRGVTRLLAVLLDGNVHKPRCGPVTEPPDGWVVEAAVLRGVDEAELASLGH